MQVTIRRMLEICGKAAPARTIDFGMYGGRLLIEIPAGYIPWIAAVSGSRRRHAAEGRPAAGPAGTGADEVEGSRHGVRGGEAGRRGGGAVARLNARDALHAHDVLVKLNGLLVSKLLFIDPTYIEVYVCREPGTFEGSSPRMRELKRALLDWGLLQEVGATVLPVPAGAAASLSLPDPEACDDGLGSAVCDTNVFGYRVWDELKGEAEDDYGAVYKHEEEAEDDEAPGTCERAEALGGWQCRRRQGDDAFVLAVEAGFLEGAPS